MALFYLKSALRMLRKRKVFSLITILGLAIGMAACLLIVQYLSFELSYDTFHRHGDHIYRVTLEHYRNGEHLGQSPYTYHKIGPALATDLPEIEGSERLHPHYGSAVLTYTRSNGRQIVLHEEDMYFADSTFLQTFTFELLRGDAGDVLNKPFSMVLSESMAARYFSEEDGDPIGQTIEMHSGWAPGSYTVTGILADLPVNSHFDFNCLLPMQNVLANSQYADQDGWSWTNFYTYLRMQPQTDTLGLQSKFADFMANYKGEDLAASNGREEIRLQALSDIYLHSNLPGELKPSGSAEGVSYFVIIALFILVIAWINYVNLATARSLERAREVGIRKTVGARKGQLITQFLVESLFFNLIAILLALVLMAEFLPVLSELIGKDISAISVWQDPRIVGVLLAILILGTLLSGLYPAFVLSSFRPASVLKGSGQKLAGGSSLRKVLVVVQFAASLALIAGTFVIYRQIQFMNEKDLGFTPEQVLVIKGPGVLADDIDFGQTMRSLKAEALQMPGVIAASSCQAIPGGQFNFNTNLRRLGAEESEQQGGSIAWVDADFLSTFGLELLAGRNFNAEEVNFRKDGVLINQQALETFKLGTAQEALQKQLITSGDTVRVLGVVKDFNWFSPRQALSPVLLAPVGAARRYIALRVDPAGIDLTLAALQSLFDRMFPGNPSEYYFLDEFFDRQYKADKQFAAVFGLFAALAILVACLGLFGLASFTAARRRKEIGVRKVLGATVPAVVWLLMTDFLKLVLFAGLIALPLAYFAIDAWLEDYASRIAISADLFLLPLALLLLIAALTVGSQSVRAALTNPVNALKLE